MACHYRGQIALGIKSIYIILQIIYRGVCVFKHSSHIALG